MEIVVKAKQSGNQQFDFLQFDHRLNPYYKLILKAVRSGTYEPTSSKPPSPPTPPPEEDDDSEDSDGDLELHPLLTASLRTPIVSTKKQNPTIPYSEQPLPPGWTVVTTDANAWERSHLSETGTELSFPDIDGMSMAMSYPPGYPFQPHSQTNPFLPPPPPPGESPPRIVDPETHPLFDMYHPSHFPAGMPVDMYTGNRHGPGTYFPAADTANCMVNVGPPIIPPPPDLKPICDKLAEYAARNGRQFEENIRAKGDPRFDFLNQTSDHYTYYQMKRKEFEQNPSKTSITSIPGGPSKSSPLIPTNKPVSFQIKAKDAKRTVIEYRSSVLFKTAKADESDEEETNEESSKDDQSKESSQNGESAISQPDVQGPKTQEDVMAEERTTKLKEEKEKEVQRLEEEAKSTTSSLRRQVQLERRRRAQLFINMLKKTTPSSEQSAPNQSNADPN